MNGIDITMNRDSQLKALYKIGAVTAAIMLVIMIVQIAVFVIWPPPDTVDGFFKLLQKNWILGLLSLDILYLLNNAILSLIYLALYAALKQEGETSTLIALMLGLIGITVYFASNIAFEMLSLSQVYALAMTEQKELLSAAGQVLLAVYKGTAFNVYYVLNAITLLIFALVMLRGTKFNRATGIFGLFAGILMIVPSSAGRVGLIFALASLVPWAIFLLLLIPRFLQLGSEK